MMAMSMGVIDQAKGQNRSERFEPVPLHIPAPDPEEARKENRPLDDEKSGTHVFVIDIS